MNRAEWKKEKKELIKKAKARLKYFVSRHAGCRNVSLDGMIGIVKKLKELKRLANEKVWENKLPLNHLVCRGYNNDEHYSRCGEIVHMHEWEKEGWSRRIYTCGHPANEYFCPKHKKDCERRSKQKEECAYCEER
jgi:hypothetical protein